MAKVHDAEQFVQTSGHAIATVFRKAGVSLMSEGEVAQLSAHVDASGERPASRCDWLAFELAEEAEDEATEEDEVDDDEATATEEEEEDEDEDDEGAEEATSLLLVVEELALELRSPPSTLATLASSPPSYPRSWIPRTPRQAPRSAATPTASAA